MEWFNRIFFNARSHNYYPERCVYGQIHSTFGEVNSPQKLKCLCYTQYFLQQINECLCSSINKIDLFSDSDGKNLNSLNLVCSRVKIFKKKKMFLKFIVLQLQRQLELYCSRKSFEFLSTEGYNRIQCQIKLCCRFPTK